MNYDEAQQFLKDLTKFGFNFGLGRIEELLRRTGDPHRKVKVIHVGGTNGKGSTCAMVERILREAGYKTGMFTSPHLHSYCERFRVNGEEIPGERLADILTRLRPHLEQMVAEDFEQPTEFEVSTALGFLYFYEEQVDFLILEVGLGGAIDSTNVVVPLVSVITNVAMDHMDYLGNSVREITEIKAGIIKEGVPLVTAADDPEALAVIQQVCGEKSAPMTLVGRDVSWYITRKAETGQRFDLHTQAQDYKDIQIPMVGDHQVVNAATAVAVIEALGEAGYAVAEAVIKKGLSKTLWPGRLEMVSTAPRVLLDGAHNLHGALTLAKALKEIYHYNRLILVIGMLGDKEREKVIAQLAPLTGAIIVTKPNSPRAGEWAQMADYARRYVKEVYVIEDIHEAVRKGMELCGQDDLVCVAGSLYMISEAREIFRGA